MGPSRSSFLCIGGDSSVVVSTGRARGASGRSAISEPQNAAEAPPLPFDEGKEKISLITYPGGSDFLKSAFEHAVMVGPSKVDPSYGSIFAECYRPPPGIRVWVPDVLTFYAATVPRMVCFFEVAFDNGLRFPLHPFMKRVLQHFNICPSQLTPNGWGILVGLLASFRDKGLGIPSLASFLHLFRPNDTTEGFLYFSRRSGAPAMISDLPSSHTAVPIGNTILLTGTTPWVSPRLGAPLIIFVSICTVFGMTCLKVVECF